MKQFGPYVVDSGPEGEMVEFFALRALCGDDDAPGAGWSYVHGPELAPDAPAGERTQWSEVVLEGRLRKAVARLNPQLPASAVQRACELVLTGTSPSVIEDHRAFHELLLSGVSVSYQEGEGEERSDVAWLVDFEHPERNEFVVVNQLTTISGTKNRRPDLLLYVNGLPLGQIECKAPGLKKPAQEAVNQVRHYSETIPDLYRYVEIIGVTDLMKAVVGTVATPVEHFAAWKVMGASEGDDQRRQLELMVDGVFAPDRFLRLIRDYVLFESDGARTSKVMAKYHQVDATEAAVESVAGAMEGSRWGGIVWHTQGAGKSYTMVFLVNRLRRDPRFENPTVVAVTDRTDLDNQLAETFTGTHLAPVCEQAEEIAGGPKSLHELLKVAAGGIVFTTIQKFQPPGGAEQMPVVSQRRNIVVMADEAHRSQYARFAENITLALPNATRVGFTGTPVEKADRSTRLVFGDYVSVYRMRQAQEDHATVPIFYESRQVGVEVGDRELLAEVEEVLEDEETDAASKLVTSWAQLEKVVGAPERLERVATDLVEHYRKRCEVNVGKAMLVAYSRRIAAEMTDRLRAELGEEAVDCVISAQATDPPELSRFRRSKPEQQELAKRFRDPDDPLRIVVVKDMWLTGFDAPVLNTLYIDKPMRDHGLLQAIARVNRVFRDKPGGLVIDYIGIGEDLRSSLRAYDDADLDEPVIAISTAVARLKEHYEVISGQLHPAGFRPGKLVETKDKGGLFLDCYDLIVAEEESTRRFIDSQAALARWFALARTQPQAIALREEVGFFARLAAEVRKITRPNAQASPEAEQAVRQFMSEGLAAGEVVDVFGLADKDRPELSVLSDEFLDSLAGKDEHRNIQIRTLEKLLNDEIRGRLSKNRIQAKEFSDEIDAVLSRYAQRQLTSAEVVEQLVEIAKRLRDAHRRHEQLGLTEEEAAFYDALAGGASDLKADPELAKLAHELVERLRRNLTVDWADRESSEAKIRSIVKRFLRQNRARLPKPTSPPTGEGGGGTRDGIDHFADAVLGQARAIYRYWPDIDDQLFAETSLAHG